jgi:hypothetical protein
MKPWAKELLWAALVMATAASLCYVSGVAFGTGMAQGAMSVLINRK